jgi:hypothetical protein
MPLETIDLAGPPETWPDGPDTAQYEDLAEDPNFPHAPDPDPSGCGPVDSLGWRDCPDTANTVPGLLPPTSTTVPPQTTTTTTTTTLALNGTVANESCHHDGPQQAVTTPVGTCRPG